MKHNIIVDSVVSLGVIVAVMIFVYFVDASNLQKVSVSKTNTPQMDINSREAWNNSSEGYLVNNAVTNRVSPKFRPVLIYRYRGTNRPAFTANGTWFIGKDGPLVATVDHLLQKKFADDLFVIRFLSPDEHTATNGLYEVAYFNWQAKLPKDDDVVFLRPKNTEAKPLPCESALKEESVQNIKMFFFNELTIGEKKVMKLRSLVTGDEYLIAGGTKGPQRIAVYFNSQPGYSGMGFVDKYDQLYVLSCGHPDKQNPISLLSGPYLDPEKHL